MSVRDNRQAGEGGKGGEVVRPAVSERDRGWLERIPGAYCLVDKQGRLRLWNSRLEELTGFSAEHIGRMQALDFFDKTDYFRAIRAARECLSIGYSSADLSIRTVNGVGPPLFVQNLKTVFEGEPMVASVALDISPLDVLQAEHARQRIRLERLASHVPGVIFQLRRDADSGRLWLPYASGKFSDVFGADYATVMEDAQQILGAIDKVDYGRVVLALERSAATLTPVFEQFRYFPPDRPRSDIHQEWLEIDFGPERLVGGDVMWHGFARRVTQHRQLERKLTRLAYYDSLTGLPNRSHVQTTLHEELLLAATMREQMAVLYLDLDNFNDINDAWSHMMGDRLLKVIADRLNSLAGEKHVLGRVGGDEFLIMLRAADAGSKAEVLAERIGEVMARPVKLGPREVRVTVSVGISIYPDDAESAQDLIRHADAAVYRAKANGVGHWARYTKTLTEAARARRYLETELRNAIEKHEIQVSLQPIVSLGDQRPVSVEALARWHHWENGWLSPNRFVSLAEKRGLAAALGEQVYRRAMQAVVEENIAGRLAINVAASQLQNPEFSGRLLKMCEKAGLAAERLEVEITERAFLNDGTETIKQIERLREAGINVTIDDFGTGYSSLSYLHRLPVQRLKIDRSFVHHIDDNPANRAIVRAIAGLAGDLGMEVIAEGIEGPVEAQVVRELGCGYGQGWFFGRPRLVE